MNREELFAHLRKNKDILLLEKKASIKYADAIETCFIVETDNKKTIVKNISDTNIPETGKFNVKVVINTTNIIDSHLDLHVNSIWKKSLKEVVDLYLFQEHKYSFDHVISDTVNASAFIMSWKELGYKYEGNTEALIFDAVIDPEDNELMAKKYKQNKVKNHSVGMRYVNIELAMNSENRYDSEEKKIWDKYYPIAVNKEVADNYGYFFVVTQAKIVEGSAVPIGSNRATPTISVTESKLEPLQNTPADIEPLKDTLTDERFIEIIKEEFNNLN